MKQIYIRGGDKIEPGVLILKEHLEDIGHRVVRSKQENYDVVVCWGCSMRDPLVQRVPALNGNVNLFNKFTALERFHTNGVKVPRTLVRKTLELISPYLGPWFGRNISHEKGRDIRIFNTWREVQLTGNKDFYTLYVPHLSEIRVWVFRGKVFAAYQKHFRNPSIENYKNMEFRSELRDDLLKDRQLTKAAIKAVEALRMDFGAVDILEGTDGLYYVLEVNSMPDISSLIRVSGIRLANLVHNWAEEQ